MTDWIKEALSRMVQWILDGIQARRDYRRARGLHHRKHLQDLVDRLSRTIKARERSIDRLEERISQLDDKLQAEAREQAFVGFMENELTSVRGIGSTLAKRIRRHPALTDYMRFRRRIHDVKGVGREKAASLVQWNRDLRPRYQAKVQELIDKGGLLPEIEDELGRRWRAHARELEILERNQRLLQKAEECLDRLADVTPRNLARARRRPGRVENWSGIDQFFRGIYAEWEEPPEWYLELRKAVDDA